MAQTRRVRVVTARHGGSDSMNTTVPEALDHHAVAGLITICGPRPRRPGGDGKVGPMKHTVCQLIVLISAILLCALAAPVSGQTAAPAAVPAKEAPAKEKAAAPAKETAPAKEKAAASAKETAPAAKEPPAEAEASAPKGSDSYQYFEYQVLAVTKKVLAEAAEYMKLPRDSEPTDELLPAIYHVGGYRVIGYSAGYATADAPTEFKMSRSEYFPDFYIMPKSAEDESEFKDGELPPPDMDGEDDDADGNGESTENDGKEKEDGPDDEESAEDDGAEDEENDYDTGSYNNLATIFPFFGEPTYYGNEFFIDLRPPRIFAIDSNMKKLSGFSNTDYGDWGRGQSPVFDDNSFSSALTATKGKPMIVAKALSGTTWILHVFFTKPQPAPEKTTPATGSENKLVRLDFRIVRAKWNEICAAGNSDGFPAVPSDEFLKKLSDSSQLRDLYSPTFRLIPSQEPVSIQLNAKTQFIPLKWVPAQEPGIPAVPLDTGAVWTGTSLKAAARIFSDNKTVQLKYQFEKANQTGWRNYQYSFFGSPVDMEDDADPVNRYARPQQQWTPEPEILSGTLRLPMLDTTAFRQTLFLEVGKPVLAARISNPAYQPDTLTLLFVTATVEEAEPPLR